MTPGDTVQGREPERARTPGKWRLDLLGVVAAALLTILAAVWAQQLWHMKLQIPLYQAGDATFTDMAAKMVAQQGWVGHNPFLAAPYGSTMQDLVVVYGDATQLFLIRLLSIVSDSGPAIVNTLYVGGFGLVAAAAYLSFRGLGFAYSVSIAVAIAFSMTRYHFERSEGHLFLGLSYAIPAAAFLLYGLLGNHDLIRRTGRTGLRTFASRRTILTVALAVLVGTSEIYYAVFTLALLAVLAPLTWITRGFRQVVLLVGLGAIIAGSALAVQAPSLAYHASHGKNPATTVRQPTDSELYGLRLAQLIVPDPYHRIGVLRDLGRSYFDRNAIEGEDRFSILGTVGTLGFLGGLLALLVSATGRVPATKEGRLARDSGLLIAVTFFIGTVSGFSAVFAYLVSPQIRGWNRLAIFIAFFSLVVVAAGWTRLRNWLASDERPDWLRSGRRSGIAATAAATLLAGFAIWDLTTPALIPNFAGAAITWTSDARFVRGIDDALPERAMVLQLPYVKFPEEPPLGTMGLYDQFFGYLNSNNLRWSYGAIKGRPEDWGGQLNNLKAPAMVAGATASGFQGITVDTHGYADSGKAIITALTSAAGVRPTMSEDGRRAWFDLRPAAARQAAGTSVPERQALRDGFLRPIAPTYGPGFLPTESDGTASWNWAGPTGSVTFSRNGQSGPLLLTFGLHTAGSRPSHVVVSAGNRTERFTVPPGERRNVEFVLPAGVDQVDFRTDAPDDATDPRDLRMQIFDLEPRATR